MRVLLVDPEADLLPALQATLLAVPGLDLYCAPDGATAVQHAQFLGGVDVLITEIFLSGVDGIGLRETLEQMRPAMRTVFLTRQEIGAYASLTGNAPVLRVPVEPAAVLAAFIKTEPTIRVTAPAPTHTPALAPTPAQHPTKHETPATKAAPVTPAFPNQPPPPSAPTSQTPNEHLPSGHHPPAASFFSSPSSTPAPLEFPSTPLETPPVSEPSPPPLVELVPGVDLGPYHILREEGKTVWGPLLAAIHRTLGRAVHLVMLEPYRAALEELRADFLADAGAKASLQHPAVLAVYEAGETQGHTFCAIERVEAQNLRDLTQHAGGLDTFWVLRIGTTVAECMLYMRQVGVPHEALSATDVLLCQDGSVRVQNLAAGGIRAAIEEKTDLATLCAALHPLLTADAPLSLRYLLERAAPGHRKPLKGWQEFLAGCVECQNAMERFKANSGPNPRVASQPQKTTPAWKWIAAAAIVVAGLGGAFWVFQRSQNNPLVPEQATVPPGQYLVAGGKRVQIEGFSIDRTEVSNRHYNKFLQWLRTHPGEAAQFDHPEQPAHHSHTPEGWKEMFPEMTKPEALEDDPRWDLPVTRVAWWDAFAFAKWAGRDLPSEEEWEAAGRGPRGLLFPWGDEPDLERAHVKRLAKPGETPAPLPVKAMNDPSAFGVLGLAGNVSEWTGTRPDNKTAILKGGNFNASLFSLDLSNPTALETRSAQIGFRTIDRKASVPRP